MDEIYKHAFRVCAIWDTQAIQLMNCWGFNIEPFCSDVCGDHRRPQTLAEICRNMGISCGFMAVAAREKYPGFMLFDKTLREYVVDWTIWHCPFHTGADYEKLWISLIRSA